MPVVQNDKSVLNSITISGFKSIGSGSQAQKIDFSDLNIIIGANGSGKSNIVSFFKLLNYMMTGALQVYVAKNGTAEEFLYFGSKKTPLFSAALEFTNSKDSDSYSFSLVKSVQDTFIFSEEHILWNGNQVAAYSGNKESYLATVEHLGKPESVIKTILSSCRAFQFHDTSSNAFIRNTSALDNDRYLMSDGGNLATYLYVLKNKSAESARYYKRIVEHIRFVMPQFQDFVLEPQAQNGHFIRLRWIAKNNPDYIMGPEQLSDGTIRFMALATLFLQPPELLPNVIIIDEPELGLHPQAVDLLARMMHDVSQYCQVIVATQSARLLDSFSPENIIIAEYDAINASSTYRHLSTAELSDWLEEYSLSQLWEKNIIGGQP